MAQFLIDDEVRDFMRKSGFGVDVLLDSKVRVHSLYGVRGIPAIVVIDESGAVRARFVGRRSTATQRMATQRALDRKR